MARPEKTVEPLKPEQLCAVFEIGDAAVDAPTDGPFGQHRALKAMRLSASSRQQGFNVFVMGRSGFGRHDMVQSVFSAEAVKRPAPADWAYVNNFATPHKPTALELPTGRAVQLRQAMQELIDDLANDIPARFESEAYQNQRRAIEQEFGEKHEAAFTELMEKIAGKDLVLLRTPMGFMIAATKDGKPLKPDEFEALPKAEQDRIDANIKEGQKELEAVLKRIPQRDKQHRTAVEKLNSGVALEAVDAAMEEPLEAFADLEQVIAYLNAVKNDLIENAEQFLTAGPAAQAGAFPVATVKHYAKSQFERYAVNVVVDNPSAAEAACPVVSETLPTLANLVGRVEHRSEMGNLVTNFTMIRPGALHGANGGFLILNMMEILTETFAWDALKRCLKSGEIKTVSVPDRLNLVSTVSLDPDPIPLNVRVALVGDRMLYYLLKAHDPDFAALFKIEADFDDAIRISPETLEQFSAMMRDLGTKAGARRIDNSGIQRLLTESTRQTDDQEKLTVNIEKLTDSLREADHHAEANGQASLDEALIEATLEEMEERAGRLRELTQEAIHRETIFIDTEGARIGQINALSVHTLGDYRFGSPSRITAKVRGGKGKVVDIEREVELGGPIHSKGVLILSSYLATHYALDTPMSLWASLVFEQTYGGVDGDSASAAELAALISALAEVPVDQSFAITGSVNQLGHIQPIAGCNEKIEGFFDVCAARGLTGGQGVIIPRSNVSNLALRPRVVKAVEAGKFSIYPVAMINEVIEMLAGETAGERDTEGAFPEGTVNAKAEARLRNFAENLRRFAKAGKDDPADGDNHA